MNINMNFHIIRHKLHFQYILIKIHLLLYLRNYLLEYRTYLFRLNNYNINIILHIHIQNYDLSYNQNHLDINYQYILFMQFQLVNNSYKCYYKLFLVILGQHIHHNNFQHIHLLININMDLNKILHTHQLILKYMVMYIQQHIFLIKRMEFLHHIQLHIHHFKYMDMFLSYIIKHRHHLKHKDNLVIKLNNQKHNMVLFNLELNINLSLNMILYSI